MAKERELQATRKRRREREEEVAKLVDAVGSAKKSIEQHEADFIALKEHVAGEEKAAQEKIAEFDAQIAEERKLREVAAARVRPDVLKKYSAHSHAARVGDGAGEERHLPGLQHEHSAAGLQSAAARRLIELCGNCNRIIYWDKLLENPDGAPSDPKEKPQQ